MKAIKKVRKFIGEVREELKKVSWPSRQELWASVVVVIAVTGLTAIFIGIVDLILARLLKAVLG